MSVGEARRRRQEGAAAVEFALVAPLLLLLLFGIISYGYMLSFRQALSQGAAEAARVAVLDFDSNAGVTDPVAAIDAAVESYRRACGSQGLTCTVKSVASCTATEGGASADAATGPSTAGDGFMMVNVTYDYAEHPLLPEYPGLELAMPDTLSYTSCLRLD